MNQDYYRQQSPITDPGPYAPLFDELPLDLSALIEIVQGLLIHPYIGWAAQSGFQVSPEREAEFQLRTTPQMVERMLALDSAPLATLRPPEKRLYGLCRDFAVLLVSLLRHQGCPARERVGFAGYLNSDWYWDHRIAEYWDTRPQHWVLVDPMIDPFYRQLLKRKFDPLDITPISPFLNAGTVWQRYRAGQVDPDQFVDSPTDRGPAMIRYALLHDFDALNKVELVGMDAWHPLIDKPEPDVTEADRTLLDQIADLTTQVDTRFIELQALYAATPYGRAVRARLEERVPAPP